jgi:hypothetical protein
MTRWLVVFQSHPTPPFDQTVVEVYAATQLHAVRDAKRAHVSHPWHFAFARSWPRGCADVDAAAKKIAGVR